MRKTFLPPQEVFMVLKVSKNRPVRLNVPDRLLFFGLMGNFYRNFIKTLESEISSTAAAISSTVIAIVISVVASAVVAISVATF